MLHEYSFKFLFRFIDGMRIVTNHLHDINELKILFESKFEIEDLCDAKKIIWMNIHIYMSSKILWLSLKSYVELVLKWFDMSKVRLWILYCRVTLISFNQCPKSDAKVEYKSWFIMPIFVWDFNVCYGLW